MPTEIQPRRSRRLSWRQTATLAGLLVRVRILNWRMTRTSARLSVREDEADSAALLRGARRWVRLHVRVAAVLDAPLPSHVVELREMFGEPDGHVAPQPSGRHITTADPRHY